LTIVLDKTKTIPYLVEMKYFEEVVLLFLIVGHTKNACDRYFNQIKLLPRQQSIYTMNELITCVAVCEDCKIYPYQAEEFLQWGAFLGKFYRDCKGLIKQHQIFRCTSAMIQESEVYVEFRQSLRDEDEPKLVNVTKLNWIGKEDHEHEGVAFDHRPDEMQEQSIPAVKLAHLNPYKQIEMWSKWGQYVPKEVAEKEGIYKQPDTDTLKKVLKEKGVRNELKEKLADLKGLDGIADEQVGDLSKKRKEREDNDDAIKMPEKIAEI
jgi:hypothetical protein